MYQCPPIAGRRSGIALKLGGLRISECNIYVLTLYYIRAPSPRHTILGLPALFFFSFISNSFLLPIAFVRNYARSSVSSSGSIPSLKSEYAEQELSRCSGVSSSPFSLPSSQWGHMYLSFSYLDFMVVLVLIIIVLHRNSTLLCCRDFFII